MALRFFNCCTLHWEGETVELRCDTQWPQVSMSSFKTKYCDGIMLCIQQNFEAEGVEDNLA